MTPALVIQIIMLVRATLVLAGNFGTYVLASASVFVIATLMGSHQIQIDEFSRLVRRDAEKGFVPISVRAPALPVRDAAGSPLAIAPSQAHMPEEAGPFRRIDLAPPGPNDVRTLAHAAVQPKSPAALSPRLTLDPSLPVLFAPDLPAIGHVGNPAVSSKGDDVIAPAQRAAVTAQLKESLGAALAENFSLFLYVSTAPTGPLAQRLYIFEKDAGGQLLLRHDWAASTGRAQYEISPAGRHVHTVTPAGFYELDPDRMYVHYHSASWDQPMPYAMFFNWVNHGKATGLAVHAASGADIARLGQRASAGCVHLSPEHARQLYNLIRGKYRGAVPRLAYDSGTQTITNNGALMRGADGGLKMADGYRVLVVIENFAGHQTVAALN